MLHILQAILLCPFLALLPGTRRKIGPFRKDNKPHGIVWLVQFRQVFLESSLILFPVPRKKDEVVELASPSDNRNVLQ